MNIKWPTHGSRLSDDYDEALIIVIDPQWTDDKIRTYGRYWCGPEADSMDFAREVWRYHTKAQDRCEGRPSDCDWYWSPDGWGKSTITVAIWPFGGDA